MTWFCLCRLECLRLLFAEHFHFYLCRIFVCFVFLCFFFSSVCVHACSLVQLVTSSKMVLLFLVGRTKFIMSLLYMRSFNCLENYIFISYQKMQVLNQLRTTSTGYDGIMVYNSLLPLVRMETFYGGIKIQCFVTQGFDHRFKF